MEIYEDILLGKQKSSNQVCLILSCLVSLVNSKQFPIILKGAN